MGWGRVKKAVKRAVRKVAPIVTQGIYDPASKSTAEKNKAEGGDDVGLRAAAAKRLVNTQQQAGGGQIKFNTMTEEPQ